MAIVINICVIIMLFGYGYGCNAHEIAKCLGSFLLIWNLFVISVLAYKV